MAKFATKFTNLNIDLFEGDLERYWLQFAFIWTIEAERNGQTVSIHWFTFQILTMPWPEAGSQESHLDLPCGSLRPNYLSSHCVLHGSAETGSRNVELEPGINLRYCVTKYGHCHCKSKCLVLAIMSRRQKPPSMEKKKEIQWKISKICTWKSLYLDKLVRCNIFLKACLYRILLKVHGN